MEKIRVVITKKHCVGTDYANCSDCAACRAVKEQYPHLKLHYMAGAEYTFDFGKTYSDIGFYSWHFEDLLDGSISEFVVNIPVEEKMIEEQNVQASVATEVKSELPSADNKRKKLSLSHEFYKETLEELDVVKTFKRI